MSRKVTALSSIGAAGPRQATSMPPTGAPSSRAVRLAILFQPLTVPRSRSRTSCRASVIPAGG